MKQVDFKPVMNTGVKAVLESEFRWKPASLLIDDWLSNVDVRIAHLLSSRRLAGSCSDVGAWMQSWSHVDAVS